MKKNLRIVSAAAAALLAVAPVATYAVSTVSADAISNINSSNVSLNNVNWGIGSVENGTSFNVKPNLVLNAQNEAAGVEHSTLTGSITATVNGKDYTALYKPDGGTTVTVKRTNGSIVNNGEKITAGGKYVVEISSLVFNLGTENANKEINFKLPKGDTFVPEGSTAIVNSKKIRVSPAGTVTLNKVTLNVTAKDLSNVSGVYFVNKDLGNVVAAGNVTLNANSEGETNLATVVAAAKKAYTAYQVNLDNGKSEGVVSLDDDLADVLKKANIPVNAAGYFKAPHTLTFNLTAKSDVNDASAKLPVTVTFANVEAPKPVTVPSTGNVTIMHAAYTYELKDGKLTRVTSADALHAYSEVPVYGTTTVNGKKYYRVSGEHEWYINAGNVDGTSRTLNHNSYVYNNKGKRVKSEGTWKKGSKHTTYGAAMNIKGNRMYRVNKNRYVKVVNFD